MFLLGYETESDAAEAGVARGQSGAAAARTVDAPGLRPRRRPARHQATRAGVRQPQGVASEYI